MRLAGKVALLTGAGSGIGRASAIAMAREGARVMVTDRDGALAGAVAEEIGGGARACAVDVTCDAALGAAVDDTVREFGRLDVLHSHAGLQVAGTLEEVEPAAMDASWALNVRSHFVAARAAVPHMKAQGGGSVIVTASNSGVQYDRGMIAYATTKHAAVAMVRQMAADYARHAIRFNALCPGFVDTPFNAGFEKQMGGRAALESYVRETIPMGRWASVDEIAEGVVYLASDASAFMTGQAFVIDGGEFL
ncbi:SDR family NAD(P)-dependent oxidoreductase [Ruegeria aquimaris]|uniref:SDR family oxidoreductase n=1 Tax=Ruegeria aquimaris TaxID=2984333 RepID=A0ABT3AEA4_9RHOB|nr:SDR family NAD(P)-dependent oxidoreductase [Ruegeria sp. XHP0148]MCV2886998.1 SDR family oxidoreductase [Ruegeria sp. XHP0148]